ncbi:MAG: DNA polymerase III subunit beta [bacterium]|nr:DNA polymerase III subunit beta [bacterium]
MKATLRTEDLQKKLTLLQHGVSQRAQLPILLNIYLEVTGGKLLLRSTDLEIGIETTIIVTDPEEGAVTVPAKPFSELVSALSGEVITLDSKEGSIQVLSKKTKSVFQTTVKDEFPRLYLEKGEKVAIIPIERFQKDLGYVVFAASTDTTRVNLSGVLLKPGEATATGKQGTLLVATDGYRLSLKHTSDSGPSSQIETSLLIPARVLREVLALREGTEDISIFVAKEQNQVIFSLGETLVVGRVIDASFPSYEKILPTDVASTIFFDKEEMLKAVRMCSIFARDAANIIKFSLRKDKIIVSSQAASLGENTVEVEASLQGEENEIAFNARYVLDILGNIQDDDIYLEMTGPLNPGVFKIKGDDSFLHLIMPIRVQG